MASQHPFQIEDQTDEDFFDNLVDDEYSVEKSHIDSKNMEKELSSLSLGDVATSLEDSEDVNLNSETKFWKNDGSLQPHENGILDSEESASFTQATVPMDSAASRTEVQVQPLESKESKVNTIKEAQWSAFSLKFQQADKDESKSDLEFLAESSEFPANELKNNDASGLSFIANQNYGISTNIGSYGIQDASSTSEQNADWSDVQYWENLYPGWKYDATTGQWYQVDYCDTSGTNSNYGEEISQDKPQDGRTLQGSLYMQQTNKPVLETIEEDSTFTDVSSWNLASQPVTEYPSNMVFDPQYPGWYYDTNTQQWYTVQSYTDTTQNFSVVHGGVSQDVTTSTSFSANHSNISDGIMVSEEKTTQCQDSPGFSGDWNASTSSYAQPNIWQSDQVGKTAEFEGFSEYQQTGRFFGSMEHARSNTNQQIGQKTFEPTSNYKYKSTNGFGGYHNLNNVENMYQFNQHMVEPSPSSNLSDSYYGTQNTSNYSQQQFLGVNNSYTQLSYFTNEGRSSDGRPGHALVAFAFGGKLIVMKDPTISERNLGHQGDPAGEISIMNLSEAVKGKFDDSGVLNGQPLDYFSSLCGQSFPGPLVGGNAATKDVNKWMDERIKTYESAMLEFQGGKLLNLLLSLLKISCQNYGKLRSPFGSNSSVEETDGPEMALTKLFASFKKNLSPYGEFGPALHCLQNPPSEGKIRAVSMEVQNLLLAGRRKEALQCAQEGQLWGPAIVLAAQLGNQFYVDTVKKMAHDQFVPGSPLRTLCLLIAGQPADVFSAYSLGDGGNTSQLPAEIQGSAILDDWEENMAIITANRTKDDELVMIHLGDCLWRERGEVTAAHTCYLVAEVNFESYSDSARLCLLGADHWRYPRTYASPDAIQRTELYEYSKVLGNSQFILASFQPYKLIYACMLAEVGKVSDSLRYCQASLKLLKNSPRAPEVEMWKSLFSSFEERLRIHQQGGQNTNLAPTKLVEKLITSIDKGIHRIIGAPSAPLPPMPQGAVNDKDPYCAAPKVANSQSTMAMSSLISSASVETMNHLTGDGSRKIMHNRSISEPDFGRSPKQDIKSPTYLSQCILEDLKSPVNLLNSSISLQNADAQSKESSGGTRFGRIGSQLLQKTMGWVSRSHQQAKLGNQNKFYYDENLKMWVEEGTKPPAEEPVIAAPPKTASFQNGMPDYNLNTVSESKNSIFIKGSGGKASSGHNSAMPPIPPSQNQFSAHAKTGVRSRYVDTFNSGRAAPASSFQSPSVTSAKSLPLAGATLFVPAPVTSDVHSNDTVGESKSEDTFQGEPSTSMLGELPPSDSNIQEALGMNRIAPPGYSGVGALNGRGRAASWGGTEAWTTVMSEMNFPTDGDKVGAFLPSSASFDHSSSSLAPPHHGGTAVGDLKEVQL